MPVLSQQVSFAGFGRGVESCRVKTRERGQRFYGVFYASQEVSLN